MARKFTDKKLDKFNDSFLEQRKALINKMQKASSVELDTSGDETDLVQGKILSDMANVLSQRELFLLNMLDASIEKIRLGTFGTCEECDAEIGEKRLIAIPGCVLCINCQSEQEKMLEQFSV